MRGSPYPSIGASQVPLCGRSWEEDMQGWERLCALLLPSCRDTGHTLAFPEDTSGPAVALRHRAEQAVNPSLLLSGWAQEAFLHHSFLSMRGAQLPLSTFVSTFPFQLWSPPRSSLGERTGWSNRRCSRTWAAGLGEGGVGTTPSYVLAYAHCFRAGPGCVQSGF